MQISPYKKFIVAFLLLVFGGQVMAAAISPCQAENSSLPVHQMQNAGSMDHSLHMHFDTDTVIKEPAMDCSTECDCCVGGCSAAVLASATTVFASRYDSVDISDTRISPYQLIAFLFRPPISR